MLFSNWSKKRKVRPSKWVMIWTTTPRTAAVLTASNVGAPAKVENTKLTQEQDEPFLGVVGHLLQAVVNVAALLERGRP